MNLQIYLNGEDYEQQCKVFNQEVLLFEGFVDDFITSVNGYIELKLNFGSENSYPVQLKEFNNVFCLLPLKVPPFDYQTIILSKTELNDVWNQLGYDFNDDLQYIKTMKKSDFKLLWLLNNKISPPDVNVENVKKITKTNILVAFEEDNKLKQFFLKLLNNDWDSITIIKLYRNKINFSNNLVYLDNGHKSIEWCPMVRLNDSSILVNLGGEWFLEIASIF